MGICILLFTGICKNNTKQALPWGWSIYTKESSPKDSVSMHRKRVYWTRFLCRENRVLWTRFLRTFFLRKSLSSCRNRVLFTRIAKNQNSFKRFLTNDIVWVLLLFSKKNPHKSLIQALFLIHNTHEKAAKWLIPPL